MHELKKTCTLLFILIIFLSGSSLTNSSLGISEKSHKFEQTNESLLTADFSNLELLIGPEEYDLPQPPILSPKAGRLGPQTFAVICVKFYDQAATRWTKAEVEDIMEIQNDLWYNISEHKITIDYQVEGWYTMGTDRNFTDFGTTFSSYDILSDAVELADPAIDYSQFEFVIALFNTPTFYMGLTATLGPFYEIETDEGDFDVGACMVGENPTESYYGIVGRIAHEMGHAFGLQHTHYDYRSVYSLMAFGFPSDLNIYGQLIGGVTEWFDEASNQVIISPGEGGNYQVRPRHVGIPIGDDQSLKVEVTDSKYFMVEVIKRWGEDKWRPNEGVYIYFVDKDLADDRECMDIDATPATTVIYDDLWDVLWQVGQTYENTTYDITIEIVSSSPAGYQVYVLNQAELVPDPMIYDWGSPPGNPPPYQTPDIWVDSQANLYGEYRYTDDYGNIEGIGDDPWANYENRLYARVHNKGDLDATGVVVTFSENTPIGLGATGTWEEIDHVIVDIDAGDSEEVFVLWTPDVDLNPGDSGLMAVHSCVKVVITPTTWEIDLGNNEAQENISHFEAIPGTQLVPAGAYGANAVNTVSATFRVGNPFPEQKDIYVNLIGETPGWEVSGAGIGEFTPFEALEIKTFTIEITPGSEVEFGDEFEAHVVGAYTRWDVPFGNLSLGEEGHLIRFGGITLGVSALYPTTLDITPTYETGVITVEGELSVDYPITLFPDQKHRNVLLEYAYEDDRTPSFGAAEMTSDGRFTFSFNVTTQGNYTITAYYAGSNILMATASATIVIDTIAGTIWTTTPTGTALFPGYESYLVIGALVTIAILLRCKKRKRRK